MSNDSKKQIEEIIKQIGKHTRNMKRDKTKELLLKIKYILKGILIKSEKGDSNE